MQSANFESANTEELLGASPGDTDYTRYGNPTLTAVESALAPLEKAAAALVFGSGMAAISSTILGLLKTGDHLVTHRPLFYGSYALFRDWCSRLGIDVTFVDDLEPASFSQACERRTRMVFVESPVNPSLDVIDLGALAAFCRGRSVYLVVDNTLATPVNQRPLEHGAHIVVHSATKYLCGHSDVVCGAIAADDETAASIRRARTAFGGILDPHAAWLLHRGLKTLDVRMSRINANALQIARFLEGHDGVHAVRYPLLERQPTSPVARAHLTGGGGLISFRAKGGAAAALRILEALSIPRLAGSLGGVESLVSLPALTFGREMSEAERQQLGLHADLIRLSVGIEHADDLRSDLAQALEAGRDAGER